MARVGEFERAQAIAETITDSNQQTFAIVHLINGMAIHEDFDAAFVLLDTLDQDRFQQMAQAGIAEGLANAGRVEDALNLVKEFERKHPWKRTVIKSSVLALVADGQVDQALELMHQLRDIVALSHIWTDFAAQIIDHDRLNAFKASGYRDRLPPQLIRALAIALTAPETMNEALFWIEQLDEDPWPDTLSEMNRILSINGHFDHALEILDYIDQPSSVDHQALVRCMTAYGEFDRAIALTEDVQGQNPDEGLLKMIAVELIQQRGDVKRAIALYETSEQVWGWPAIAAAVAKTGDLAQATDILERQFDSLMLEIETLSPGDGRDFAISLLLVDVVLAQGFEQAFELVDKMQPFAQAQGLRDILVGLAIVGDHSRMIEVFAAHEREFESQQKEWSIAVSTLAKSQYFDAAIALLEQMEDEELRLESISILAREMAQMGDGERAVALIQEVPSIYFDRNSIQQRPEVGLNIREVIYELVEQGNVNQALQVAEAADDPFTQAIWKMTVAFRVMEAGDFQTSGSILDQVLVDIGCSSKCLNDVFSGNQLFRQSP